MQSRKSHASEYDLHYLCNWAHLCIGLMLSSIYYKKKFFRLEFTISLDVFVHLFHASNKLENYG